MRDTSIIDNLNCKTQAYTRVCKENELKKITPIETILYEFEGSYRKNGEEYQDNILKDDYHSIKVLVTF